MTSEAEKQTFFTLSRPVGANSIQYSIRFKDMGRIMPINQKPWVQLYPSTLPTLTIPLILYKVSFHLLGTVHKENKQEC